jgi:hypothetical protein
MMGAEWNGGIDCLPPDFGFSWDAGWNPRRKSSSSGSSPGFLRIARERRQQTPDAFISKLFQEFLAGR